jgi:hypothetical protein
MKITKSYLQQLIKEELRVALEQEGLETESKAAAALALGSAIGMGGMAAHHASEMDKAITAKTDRHDVSKINPGTLKQGFELASGTAFVGNKFELQKAVLDYLEDGVLGYKQNPKTGRGEFFLK